MPDFSRERLDVADVERIDQIRQARGLELTTFNGGAVRVTLYGSPGRLVAELLRLARLGALAEARDAAAPLLED